MSGTAKSVTMTAEERRQLVLSRLEQMLERAEREELTGDVQITCNFRRGRMYSFTPDFPEKEYFGD